MTSIWRNKVVLVGITGGIAVYKIVEAVSTLRKFGADLRIVMTKNATRFVAPLTFREIANAPVYYDMWREPEHYDMAHISLANEADICLVAPATANFIGKLAYGIADDLLMTTLLATKAPIVISPAMNTNMWLNPAVSDNVSLLKERGVAIIEPGEGHLACGQTGKGRLPQIDTILFEAEKLLWPQDLSGKRFLITAGPTREYVDDFRFVSNPSTGKMGVSLAKAANLRGATVDLVLGPSALEVPGTINVHRVVSALEMYDKTRYLYSDADVVIGAAAVSDFRPEKRFDGKIKREGRADRLPLNLIHNPDILGYLAKERKKQIIVGFAAESRDVILNAQNKLVKKELDLIVANDISRKDTGFAADTNSVWLLSKNFEKQIDLSSKDNIAQEIIDTIVTKFL